MNFWYKKIIPIFDFLISEIRADFVISEIDLLISENDFLISENRFLMSENFWYQKIISDIRNFSLFSDIRKLV